jgi:translation initiation factor IF-2
MSKVRINDLARELEVKSRAILDVLDDVGVTEKKTHSSSLEGDEAERVRVHFKRGGRGPSSSQRHDNGNGDRPKIDLSQVKKPGDVLKAIQERKEQANQQASGRPVAVPPSAQPLVASAPAQQRPVVAVGPPANRPPLVAAAPAAPVVARPAAPAPVEPVPTQALQPVVVAPRRIVPQPRQAPNIVHSAPAPAISAKPPAGPVVGRPPVSATPSVLSGGQGIAAVPPRVPVAPPVTVAAPVAAAAPVAEAPAPVVVAPAVEAAPESTAAVVPPRRVIMPQTGPRPVYTAPPPVAPRPTPPPAANYPQSTYPGSQPRPGGPGGPGGAGLQRGRPIFDRGPRPSGPGAGPGYGPRPGAPGGYNPTGPSGPGGAPGRRPMHPTRSSPTGAPGARPGFGPPRPGGPGGRPGFGARPGMGGSPGAGGLIPAGEAPRPQRPSGPPRGRGRQQYPKTKEGPMKGFAPPPRFGGSQISMEPLPITRTITVTEGISVKDLAEKLEVRGKDLIASLLIRGVMVTVNQSLDAELVKDVARQFGADTNVISFEDEMANEALETFMAADNSGEIEVARPPVVTVMGHVDHGKTSLLDAIRETEVAAGEAGGITQHIGAYKVRISKADSPAFGREIVFLDTPGHEAFTRMRARGAKVTDIVVVVVAADDGVMPQTIEAIDHAKAANVPIIVAVNKIDKPDAQPDRVKQQLGDRGLVPESWGGSTVFVDVSAKKHTNLDLLLEMICLTADIADLKASPERSAVATVIEAKLDRGRGVVASVLVQNGTLKSGDSFIVGNSFGKVRAMFDDRGRAIEEAGPSTPVEILGLEGMPDAGDTFLVVSDRDKAKTISTFRAMKQRESQLAKSSRVSLEGLAEQIKQAGVKELPLIIKGDVTGSVEVLADSLQKMSTEKVRIRVIHTGVGAINESDILLASASNAIVIGFNVRPDRKSAEAAEQEGVEIRLHSIIYEVQDEIRKAMLGLLDPVYKENFLGRALVQEVFRIPKIGTIAGCRVTDGSIKRDAEVRVVRGGEQVFKGKLGSLKRFKDDAREVTNGMECGIGINGFSDIQQGDTIEAFAMERVAAELTAS